MTIRQPITRLYRNTSCHYRNLWCSLSLVATPTGANQLRDWIKRREFNQAEAAQYLGMTEPYLSKVLSDTHRPGLNLALDIETLTGIPVKAWAVSEHPRNGNPVPVTGRKR